MPHLLEYQPYTEDSSLIYNDSKHLTSRISLEKTASMINHTSLTEFTASDDDIEEPINLEDKLYEEGASVSLPKDLFVQKLTNLIPMKTIFDKQSKLGKFFIHDNMIEELKKIKLENRDTLISNYSESLMEFAEELLRCLELRDKYQTLSGQNSYLNPVNSDTWETYPPPLPKGWHYNDEYGMIPEGEESYYYDEKLEPHYFGQTFDMKDYEKFFFERNRQSEKEEPHDVFFDKKLHAYQIPNFQHHLIVPKFSEYFKDLTRLIKLTNNKVGTSLSYRRLCYLYSKFEQYSLLNENKEVEICKLNPHRDFYNVRKIDNNVDLSMCMSRKALLNVINSKLEKEPKRVVYKEGDVELTLEQLFESYFNNDDEEEDSESPERERRLNIDDLFEFGIIDRNFEVLDHLKLDSSTDYGNIINDETLVRIDRTFLRMDNAIGGEYLADLIKQVCSDYERTKYQYGELGLNFNMIPTKEEAIDRWSSIANWVIDHKLISHNVKWIVRIPRNYSILKKMGKLDNFQNYLDALFKPLFEISLDPTKNLKLHYFLTKVSALDLLAGSFNKINDISLFEHRDLKPPSQWTDDSNPPYSYYLYYIFLNLSHLNKFRQSQNMNCLCLRNHTSSSAEAHSDPFGIISETLSSNFLIGKNIINGENLQQYPILQYIYYLKQIGITMSPLCWNKRIEILNDDERHNCNYETHPCIKFFKTGMKVALSTSKPLFSSLTRDPLIEEYSIANSIHKLGAVDVCELARNSVLLSGFNGLLKRHWIGVKYVKEDPKIAPGLDWKDSDDFAIQRCNVPNMRIRFRRDAVALEHQFIKEVAGM